MHTSSQCSQSWILDSRQCLVWLWRWFRTVIVAMLTVTSFRPLLITFLKMTFSFLVASIWTTKLLTTTEQGSKTIKSLDTSRVTLSACLRTKNSLIQSTCKMVNLASQVMSHLSIKSARGSSTSYLRSSLARTKLVLICPIKTWEKLTSQSDGIRVHSKALCQTSLHMLVTTCP